MAQNVIIDLHSDFAAACAAELQAAGYAPPAGPPAEVIRAYANVRHRRVAMQARAVHKAAYTVPPALVAGERLFLSKVAAGDDLRPHQSTLLERADFDDGMLNDFGIQHFHLGTAPHPSNAKFVARTEPVLFALVKPHDFYSLGCHAHGAWTQTKLLDLIHDTWPALIESMALKHEPDTQTMALGQNYTDSDVKKLRNAGINALTQRPDGTIHFGPGGGITGDRKSGAVAVQVTQIKGMCNGIEREIRERAALLITKGELTAPISVRLEQRGAKGTFAVVEGSQIEFDLGGALSVPPL